MLNDQAGLDILFSPCTIGSRTAVNRFVAQPMEINAGLPGGKISPDVTNRYQALAKGRWGVIIIEALSITAESVARQRQLVITDETTPAITQLVRQVKENAPETLVVLQITHSGVESDPAFSKCVSVWPPPTRRANDPRVHTLTDDEIGQISEDFLHAFWLAEQTGADGIDFKVCHGYLGAEFLRPANLRPGPYGRSGGNRFRFFKDTAEKYLTRRSSRQFLFGTRFSFFEGIPGGFGTAGPASTEPDYSESLAFVELCQRLGLDYLNVSAGIPSTTPDVTRPNPKCMTYLKKHFLFQKLTKSLAGQIVVVGSGYSAARIDLPKVSAENLEKGVVDFIGLGRQNLADPEYPMKLRAGGPALKVCTLCGGCSELLRAQEVAGCVAYDREAMKRVRDLRKRVKLA